MAVCRDVMTRGPACCEPTDYLVSVAELMKSQDVGAVPVVDGSSRKLVSMVTDRDCIGIRQPANWSKRFQNQERRVDNQFVWPNAEAHQ